jgi:hypothetical protein
MSTRLHCDCRPKIVYPDGRIELIATFDDLREALYLMQGSSPNTGVTPYVLEWFEKIFLPSYRSKRNIKASGKDSYGNEVTETQVGLTSDELIAKTLKEQNKNLSSKDLLQRYLDPLRNQGLIDSVPSIINKSRKVFFPSASAAMATKSFFHSLTYTKNESFDKIRFEVVNPAAYPSEDILEMQIEAALKHSTGDHDSEQQNNSLPKIFDETCKNEKNARMIVEEFFSFPDNYFTKASEGGGQKDENSTMSTVHAAVAKSLTPTLGGEDKNEIDPVQLNELLLSVID